MTENNETVGALAVKATPPVSVSLATVFGYTVSDEIGRAHV